MSKTTLDEIKERWSEERKARKAGKRSFDFDKKATEDIAYLLQRVEELEKQLDFDNHCREKWKQCQYELNAAEAALKLGGDKSKRIKELEKIAESYSDRLNKIAELLRYCLGPTRDVKEPKLREALALAEDDKT